MNTRNNNTTGQNNAGQTDKSTIHQDQPRQRDTQDQQQKQDVQQMPKAGQDDSDLDRNATPNQASKPAR
jgi:hypothetical protein